MRALVLAALVALALLAPATGRAQGLIQEIRIEGTQRIDPATVVSYMNVSAGDPFEAGRLDRALKALFATGLFADVTLRREGGALVVRVVENPIINRIAFEGNRRLETDTLRNEVQLRPRVVYTRTKVQNDVQRLLDVYRRSGRFAATVEPKIIQLPQNRVDLVFEISEGERTKIRRISFVGNKVFSDSRLRDVISTKESAWYRFFGSDDSYDPDRLTFDREQLRRHYLRNGYADFRVNSAVAELTPDKEAFYVTFTVEEGERYDIGKVTVNTSLKALDPSQLDDVVLTKTGQPYNADLVDKTIDQMTDRLGQIGYAFVDVRVRPERNRETQTVDLTYDVAEGPRVFVEEIVIAGNLRTLDEVIRREFRLAEGDAFNSARLRRSRQRIQNLGFFEKVEITNVEGSAPDKTRIETKVQERSTGEITFGVGFSSADALLGDVSIRERNFLGRGQDLRVGFLASTRSQEFDLGFTEPYFLDRDLSAGFDLFRISRDNQDTSSFDLRRTGGAIRFGYQITEPLRQTVRYTIRDVSIRNVQETASRYIRDQEGTTLTSAIGQELLYDKRDNRLDPKEGYSLRLGNELAGFGGDTRFIKTTIGAGHYLPVLGQSTLVTEGEIGAVVGLGEDVRIGDRYFVGSRNFRGFETGGIGPRDAATGDSLGANYYYVGTVELRFPLGLPDELGFTGAVFTDIGSAFDVDTASSVGVNDKKSLRATVGVGVAWKSPMGPLRIDMAVPYLQEDYDQTEFFRFNFGARF